METQQAIADLIAFRNERGWQDFHTLPALARALGIEASEVEKIFLWQHEDAELSEQKRQDLRLELADVLTYAYYMCEQLGVDPNAIIEEKLAINKQRHWEFEDK
ncbi:nucleotide pyrophosphohydrolase [Lacticaseibacillus jixiensis]|uniref:nucleotide pyrophosphohydrolase n=1 Tax=Lacticaseibacillus jixiensis TaxID=3231926 RepID=UPI0036F41BD6